MTLTPVLNTSLFIESVNMILDVHPNIEKVIVVEHPISSKSKSNFEKISDMSGDAGNNKSISTQLMQNPELLAALQVQIILVPFIISYNL